jgi:AcrR family transcriptional regulator
MINKNMLQIKPILSPKERRQRNREEIRSMILATALEIIRQDGAGALNLNELARRVQMRPSSIYVYFSGKMAIYDALFEMGVALYREEIQKVSKPSPIPGRL